MIQPIEMKLGLPMVIHNGVVSTTTIVWEILVASREGNLEKVQRMAASCPELLYAQYNYTPPIHFAVREGHLPLVKYLLDNGALDPTYRIYPFLDNLYTIADDRGFEEIASLLKDYNEDSSRCKFKGDNGEIHYNRTALQQDFQKSVDKGEIDTTREILKEHPEFAEDLSFFWGEGIMSMPAHDSKHEMLELLMHNGARVPSILKWCQYYYFNHFETAVFLMQHGMNAEVMSWHHVTLLHDMAQKGFIPKAELLVEHGADINALEEEYCSTPLGMAARWGHEEMVEYLLKQGADPNKAASPWARPLAWARKKGHKQIEEILLKAGAN